VKYALQTGTPSVPYSIPAWAQPTFADSLIGPKVTSFEDLLLQARERDRQTYETLCERARNVQRDRHEKCRGDQRQPSIAPPSLAGGTWARIR
jgi:hypothetical protein